MKSKIVLLMAMIAFIGLAVTLDHGQVWAQQEGPPEPFDSAKAIIPVEFSTLPDVDDTGIGDPRQVLFTQPPDAPGGPNPRNTFDFGDEIDVDALANEGDYLFWHLASEPPTGNKANLLISFQDVIRDHLTQSVIKSKGECDQVIFANDGTLTGHYVVQGDSDGVWLRGLAYGTPTGAVEVTSAVESRSVYIQFRSSDYNDGIADIYVDGNLIVRIDTYERGDWYVQIRGLSNTTHTVKVKASENYDFTGVIVSPHHTTPDIDSEGDLWVWYFCFGPSDPQEAVYMEDLGGYTCPKWSNADLDFDSVVLSDVRELDGLEVWGPLDSDDANYYSLEGDPDPTGIPDQVSVYRYTVADPDEPYIAHSIIVNAVVTLGYAGPEDSVDLDALMVWDVNDPGTWSSGDAIIFSIRAAGNWDGGELVVMSWAKGAQFLNHGGHLWDTAFNVQGAFDVSTEEVDAIESYPVWYQQTPTLTQWGLIVLVALLVVSTVFVILRRRKAAVPA